MPAMPNPCWTPHTSLSLWRCVAPVLNNTSLYKTGAGEYLEPGLFNFDLWGFIVYNFPSKIIGPGDYLKCRL
jgi:hypothetical protein